MPIDVTSLDLFMLILMELQVFAYLNFARLRIANNAGALLTTIYAFRQVAIYYLILNT